MLNVLVLAVLVVAGAIFVLFVKLCLAIRKEDSSWGLTARPPSAGAAIVRRITGLSVRRSADRANSQPDPRLALFGSAPHESNERR